MKRGHCTECLSSDDKDFMCTKCDADKGYTLNAKGVCAFDCKSLKPAAKPAKPENVQDLNGQPWPEVCFQQESAHFFTIGDWGGVCNWDDNLCKPGVPGVLGNGMPNGAPGQPVPAPNRGSGYYTHFEANVQAMVKDRMVEVTEQLKAAGTPPKFIINVGDNFYPGGIDTHCGANKTGPSVKSRQFEQIWDQFYPAEKLENMEWWSVLGNHDYGGVCYVKGWDHQITYTWENERWVMPGQYWSRRVHFETFKVDFWFLDGNVFDVMHADNSMCSPASNPGKYCELTKYPNAPGTSPSECPLSGPTDAGACQQWFKDLWKKQYDWLTEQVPKSDADWQIVVNHYPASFALGEQQNYMVWSDWLEKAGVDLYISGHTHEQKVYYGGRHGGVDYGKAAWVITGGGGGISSEVVPLSSGEDDAYGFMDMEIDLNHIKITAYSHGGTEGKLIIRNQTTVTPIDLPKEHMVSFV